MAEASINDVVNKLAEISDTLKKMSGAAASTYAAQQEKYRTEFEARSKQPDVKQKSESDAFARNIADYLFGRKAPGDLSSKERSRYKKIGEILKPVFNAEGIIKSLGKFADDITEGMEQQHRESLLQRAIKSTQTKPTESKKDSDKPKKQSWFESIVSSIGPKLLGGAALLAIGMGIAHLVKGVGLVTNLSATKLTVFGLAFGAILWGLSKALVHVNKLSTSLIAGALAVGTLMVLFKTQLVPGLKELATIKWEDIKGGMLALGIVLGSLVLTIVALNKYGSLKKEMGGGGSTWQDVLKNALASGTSIGMLYALACILRYELAPALLELSKVKWDEVKGGLAAASLALGGISLIAGALAKVLHDPTMAGQGKKILTAIATGGAIWGLVELLGRLAVNMQEFTKYKWDDITNGVWGAQAALGGMTAIAGAIGALLYATKGAGIVAGGLSLAAIYALAENLGHIADKLARFSAVDTNKLIAVGDALLPLSKGMLAFLSAFSLGGTVSVASNIIDSIMSIFDRDIVGVIVKYESIDAAKIAAVGTSLKMLAEGLTATLQSAKLSTSSAKESAKAVSEFIGVLTVLKSTLPGNTLQIKIGGNIDQGLLNAVNKLAIDLRDINSMSSQANIGKLLGDMHDINNSVLQTHADKIANAINSISIKQVTVSGISELQKIIKDINAAEIDLLTEQRDILKDVRSTLRESNMHLQALIDSGTGSTASTGSKSYIREERSLTREHYLKNTNLFQTTVK